MELIELYEVHEWDGGDLHKPSGNAFWDKAVAREVADPYGEVVKLRLRVFESVQDFKDSSRAELRKRALAKLTPEEIDALGVSE